LTRKTKVYLASPFFNDEEVARVAQMERTLRSLGLEVFSPREAQYEGLVFGTKEWRTAVFHNNVQHILDADVVVAIHDVGQAGYPDSGTVWEMGVAAAEDIPLIIFNEKGANVNLMIADSLHAYIDSFESMELYDFEQLPRITYNGEVF
jgi:nucleoside 2-deoxyribosyltransferase